MIQIISLVISLITLGFNMLVLVNIIKMEKELDIEWKKIKARKYYEKIYD